MANLFPRVNGFKLGYHPREVDEYFAEARQAYEQPGVSPELASFDVRRVSFDLKRGGYSTSAVDSALDRLEVAFATRVKERFIKENGHDAWMADLAERAQALYPRLRRPAGERFARPHGVKSGYDAKEVDAILDRVTSFFDEGKPITADEVRALTFRRRSKWSAYEERVVDAYLARTVDILLGAA